MNRILTLAMLVLAASAVRAGDNELTAEEKAQGWKLLFDGKSTEGWANREKNTLTNWKAVEGSLKRVDKGGDIVCTADQFENFEFKIDWKTKGNSGVFVRMSSQKDWLNTGMEIQVDRKAGGKHGAGALYDLVAPPKEAMVKDGDWNTFHIVCDGPKVNCKMNGVETFKIDVSEEMWKKPQGKFKLPYGTLPRKGFIMMQDHGAEVEYKNIKVRVLK